MRIVVALDRLDGLGGSELYAVTVAEELERLGHEVVLRAAREGASAELAESRGLTVDRDGAVSAATSAALVLDAPSAYGLAAVAPGLPQLFVAMSELLDPQLPPFADGVVSGLVALSERVARQLRASVVGMPIHRLRQPIDTRRFQPGGPLPTRPQRALLLSNYLRGSRLDVLRDAWESAGVECVTAGASAATARPEALMRSADIVVGKARVALEGMASGKAVYVFDLGGCDGWVTAKGWAAMEADAFGGQATDRAVDPASLRADLDAYDPLMGVVNRDLVTRQHAARTHAAALVELLRGLEPQAAGPPREAAAELARANRLLWRVEEDRWRLQGALEVRDADRAAWDVERNALGTAHEAERRALDAASRKLEGEVAQLSRRLDELEARVTTTDQLVVERDTELRRLRALVDTRRVRAGLAAGRAVDRLALRRPGG